VGKKTEMAKKTTTAQTEKIMVEARKRMVNTRKTAEETRKTAAVNKKTEGESLYQNRCNTCQTDGMTMIRLQQHLHAHPKDLKNMRWYSDQNASISSTNTSKTININN
jgi:cytochrome c5